MIYSHFLSIFNDEKLYFKQIKALYFFEFVYDNCEINILIKSMSEYFRKYIKNFPNPR